MPTIQTKELTGRALDWAVATAIGKRPSIFIFEKTGALAPEHQYSTDWAKGGPLIDQFNITIIRADDEHETDADGYATRVRVPQWFAQCDRWTGHSTTTNYEHQHMEPTFMIEEKGGYYGTTSLIAAMRALVVFKLGPSVDIPQELLTNQGAS